MKSQIHEHKNQIKMRVSNKIIITIVLAAMGCLSYGQVIITEEANPVPTNSSVLLEFGSEPKGIILPSVTSAPGAVGGTFIANTTVGAVQYYDGAQWVNLTDTYEESDPDSFVPHGWSNEGTEDLGEGVVIGAESITKPGILVLESTTQALVLPKVANPHTSIQTPIAGTIVYDTASDTLAVYDGSNWSFWK